MSNHTSISQFKRSKKWKTRLTGRNLKAKILPVNLPRNPKRCSTPSRATGVTLFTSQTTKHRLNSKNRMTKSKTTSYMLLTLAISNGFASNKNRVTKSRMTLYMLLTPAISNGFANRKKVSLCSILTNKRSMHDPEP